MVREQIEQDLANAQSQLETTKNHPLWNEAYKQREIPILENYIACQQDTLAGYDRLVNSSTSQEHI